jgi:hypothetical protein
VTAVVTFTPLGCSSTLVLLVVLIALLVAQLVVG